MATFNLTKGSSAAHMRTDPPIFKEQVTLDFSKTPYSAADVLELINVPANTFVQAVHYEVETAEGAVLTFTLGDAADPDGFVAGADGNAVGSGMNTLALTEGVPNTITGYSGGKFYSAADTIDMVLANAAAAAKVTVTAIMVDLS